MEKKFDPRGKERKRTNRKKWYKAVCSLAAAVVVCTVYTLMLPALTLDEESAAGIADISESSVPTSEAPAAAEISKSDNGSESHNDTAADSSADSSHAATESGPAAAAPSDDSAPSTTKPTTEGENNAPVTLPTEETNSGAITGSSESHDEVTSPDTDDQEKIKDEENNDSPAADKEETDEEEADNSGSSTDADTEEDDSEKSDDTADVEDASYWETTIPDLSDCETWAEKLLAVAGSQLGYHESILNFRVDNDGNHKGYTRYGEWYGNPYGDWCAMFVSFCLKYAGIDQEAIPQNANCSDWVTNLKKMEIYEDADLYVPEAGDIVFFDQSDADRPNHVGIISEVTYGTKTVIRHITKDGSAIESGAMNALKYINEATSDDASGDELRTEEVEVPVAESIKVIEGNSSDQVQYVDYDLSNEKILGYVSMTNAKNVFEGTEEKKPVEEQKPEENKIIKEQEVSGYSITVDYGPEANIPETASLVVTELSDEDEAYTANYEQMVNALVINAGVEDESELNISSAKLFDISFMDGEMEIEPEANVNVNIKCNENAGLAVSEDQTFNAVHVTNDGTVEILDVNTETDEEDNVQTLSFEQGSFSVTGVIVTNDKTQYLRAKNASKLEDGKAYIVYYKDSALGIHADGTNLSKFNFEKISGDSEADIKAKKSEATVWYYNNGKLYTKTSNGNVKYLSYDNSNYSITLKCDSTGKTIEYSGSDRLYMPVSGYNYSVVCKNNKWQGSYRANIGANIAEITSIDVILTENYSLGKSDDIINSGSIKPLLLSIDSETGLEYETDQTLTSGQKYVWYKSLDGGKTWNLVERKKASGDKWNIADESGTSLNIALDNGALSASQKSVSYKVKLVDANGNDVVDANKNKIESKAFDVTYYDSVRNGSFETPVNGKDKHGKVKQQVQYSNAEYKSKGGVWQTTGMGSGYHDDHDIEILNDTSENPYHSGNQSGAQDGHQYAEINCEANGALYQDVLTNPGDTLNWAFSHQARAVYSEGRYTNYNNTMMMIIMSADDAKDITTQADITNLITKLGANKDGKTEVDYNGKKVLAYRVTNNSRDRFWHTYTSENTDTTYDVPDGQYLTRFYFVAVAGSNGDTTIGNYIDNVYFTKDSIPPTDGSAKIVLKKKIYGLSEDNFTENEDGTLHLNVGTDMTFTISCDDSSEQVIVNASDSDVKWKKETDGSYTMAKERPVVINYSGNKTNPNFTVSESKYENIANYDYVGTHMNVYYQNELVSNNDNIYSYSNNISENGMYTVEFTNTYTPIGVELPETGGLGTTLLYLLGAMLITAPLTITFIKRRRQEEEEN